ncbi:MAG: pyruvate dehydrogenase (acetyl-transferring) E1 component subunit alpha [Oleispira sp.]|jgi:pyruvate dehydrogenase E1 component alpha subunit|nr:pyruvate dehydrogenase (acetyl-transferring) E1 component subunit alpha [Oleispira sp.]
MWHNALSAQQGLSKQDYLAKPLQYLSFNGEVIHAGGMSKELPECAHDKALLRQAYRWMNLTRAFDQKAVALQRTGIIGTYPSSLGQEAIAIACGMALEKEDVFVPYYRDHGTLLVRGHLIEHLLLYWGGDERGSSYAASNGSALDMPICVPIATQASHAVGIASAFKIQQKPQAVLCTLGDGASSKGDFLEALNLAGSWHLPVVFVINNNQWAISVPRHIQSGAPTLAQKGLAAAIPNLQVDGNDFIALYEVLNEALQRARKRKGPMLIEAISYRLSDHTTADDASRYREQKEVDKAWRNEPIKRLQSFMHRQGYWDKKAEACLQDDCQTQIEKSLQVYQRTEAEQPESMFDYLYESWPASLDDQVDACSEKFMRNRDGER